MAVKRSDSGGRAVPGPPGAAAIPVVVLVGGTNVGKSTLFNRLLRERRAIVSAQPGTTRDLLTGVGEGPEGHWRLVDTPEPGGPLVSDMIAAAALVLLVVDARSGCTPADRAWADRLHRAGRPFLVVVNKVDGMQAESATADFFSIALTEPIAVAAIHGSGIDALLTATTEPLAAAAATAGPVTDFLTLALVGRPNAGKSTLGNRLLGHHRSRVEVEPGTTRDVVEGWGRIGDRWLQVLDTAGRDRQARDPLLQLAAERTRWRLRECDVVALVVDAGAPVHQSDRVYLRRIHDLGKPVVVVGNKIDRSGRPTMAQRDDWREAFAHGGRPPILFLSAHSGAGCHRLLPAVVRLARDAGRQLSTGALHAFLEEIRTDPTSGRRIARHAVQVGVRPPQFLFLHAARQVPPGYRTFLKNRLQRRFRLEGVPVRVQLRRAPDSSRRRSRRPTRKD